MDDILNKIIETAGLSEEEAQKLKNSFYGILSARLLEVFNNQDQHKLNQLLTLLQEEKIDQDKINSILEEASENSETKEAMNKAVEETLSELTDTINESATEEQKQQILASL